MEREFVFNCTNMNGEYTEIKSSGMDKVLEKQGAQSTDYTCSKICEISPAFQSLPGYDEQSSYESPVCFSYIPMHLSKRDDMPSAIRPVYTVSVAGAEHSKRDSSYSCVSVMDYEQLGITYNCDYLRQIFGTHLLTWQDMREMREGRVEYGWAEPTPVHTEFKDIAAVVHIIQTIYKKKNIVIKLEKNAPFNRRAQELLLEVYSLLDPRFAVETGFATYQNSVSIASLIRSAGVRIYIIPWEYDEKLPTECELLDMNALETISVEDDDLAECLGNWMSIPEETRRAYYAGAFTDDALSSFFGGNYERGKYIEPEQFIEVSNAFFDEYNRITDDFQNAGVTNLVSAYNFYNSYPQLKCAGEWYNVQFANLIRSNSDLLGTVYYDTTAEISKGLNADTTADYDAELAQFGIMLLGSENTLEIAGGVGESGKQIQWSKDSVVISQKANEMAAQKQTFETNIANLNKEHEAQKEALAKEYADEKEALNKSHAEAVAALNTAHAAAIDQKLKELADQKDTYEKKQADLQADHEKKQAELQADCEKKIADQKANYDAVVAERDKTIQDKTAIIAERDTTISLKTAENEEQKSKISAQDKEIVEKTATISTLTKETAEKTAQITALTDNVATKTKTIDELQAKADDLEKTAGEQKKSLAAKDEQISGLNSDVSKLKKNNQQLSEKNGDLQKKIDSSDNELKELEADKNAEIDKLNRAIEKYKAAGINPQPNAVLMVLVGFILATAICVGAFFFVLKPKYTEQIDSQAKTISTLTKENKDYEQQSQENGQKIQDMQDALNETTNALTEAQEKNDALTAAAQAKEAEAAAEEASQMG